MVHGPITDLWPGAFPWVCVSQRLLCPGPRAPHLPSRPPSVNPPRRATVRGTSPTRWRRRAGADGARRAACSCMPVLPSNLCWRLQSRTAPHHQHTLQKETHEGGRGRNNNVYYYSMFHFGDLVVVYLSQWNFNWSREIISAIKTSAVCEA